VNIVNIIFSSSADRKYRQAIEDLLFFNPQQDQARTGILNSLKRFGLPRLKEVANGVEIQVDEYETQTIYAYNQDEPQKGPAGIIVFLRSGANELGIIHVAVQPEYSLQGCHAAAGLTFMLVDEVRRISHRIKGIERLLFFYHKEHGLPV
jgi:hypothetical protein